MPRVIEQGFAGGDEADEQAGEFGQLRWSERSALVQPTQVVAEGEPDKWVLEPMWVTPATFIADPSGCATVDSEARTAITAMLAVLKNAGLVKAE